MSNLTNYHSHTTYCDGKSPAEDFVKEAIAQGFYSYGMSSHAPLPFPTNWTMKAEDMSSYITEINALKAKYEGQIQLYVGLEIDYLDDEHNPKMDAFQDLELDYRIGSVHLIRDLQGEIADLDMSSPLFKDMIRDRFDNDLVEVIKKYFSQKKAMVRLGGFDFVGHIDKVSMNASFCEPGITAQPWYKKEIASLFEEVARVNQMIEINTKAFMTKGLLFPNKEHFGLINDMSIPVLVNSDSHHINKINNGRREAFELLYKAGIKTVMELDKGQWKASEIIL